MLEILGPVLAAFAACFFLASTMKRHWKGASGARRLGAAAGWTMLAVAAWGFGTRYGWEVGLAWLVIWLGSATLLATAWLTYHSGSALRVGGLLAAITVVAWIA